MIAQPPLDVATLRAPIDATVGTGRVTVAAPAISEEQAAALKALGYVE